MKSRWFLNLLLLVALVSYLYAQQPKKIVYRVKPKPAGENAVRLENAHLKFFLSWAFGGKMQRGWHLYELLIAQCIGVSTTADGEEFAAAVTRWQRAAGLTGSGILDEETWLKMVAHWQARRSKDRAIPTTEKLVTVAADEFYDPERPAALRQVERATYAAYKRMVAAATADLGAEFETGEYLKIISAFRSPAYQQKLRAQSPHSGRAGLAVNSPHFTGRALDLYVGGEPVSTNDANRALQVNTKAYRWLVKNAGKFGFIPYFYEPWHWEYNPAAAQ